MKYTKITSTTSRYGNVGVGWAAGKPPNENGIFEEDIEEIINYPDGTQYKKTVKTYLTSEVYGEHLKHLKPEPENTDTYDVIHASSWRALIEQAQRHQSHGWKALGRPFKDGNYITQVMVKEN